MRDHESDIAGLISAAIEHAGLSPRPLRRRENGVSSPRPGLLPSPSGPEHLADPDSIESLGDTGTLYQRRDDSSPSLSDLEAILRAAVVAQARSIFAQAVASGGLTELPMEIGSPGLS